MAIIHRRQDKDKRVFSTFCQFRQGVLSSSRNNTPGGLARPGSRSGGHAALEQEFARREAPVGRRAAGKPSFCPKAPGARWGKNAVMAPQTSSQAGQGVAVEEPAGGRFRQQPRGAGYAGHDRREAAGVSPRHYPVSLFSAGFGPLGPKPPKFPDIAAKRAGPGG